MATTNGGLREEIATNLELIDYSVRPNEDLDVTFRETRPFKKQQLCDIHKYLCRCDGRPITIVSPNVTRAVYSKVRRLMDEMDIHPHTEPDTTPLRRDELTALNEYFAGVRADDVLPTCDHCGEQTLPEHVDYHDFCRECSRRWSE